MSSCTMRNLIQIQIRRDLSKESCIGAAPEAAVNPYLGYEWYDGGIG